MDKNTLIQLAKDVYRLSLLFPNKEPLRYRMRAIADDIIVESIMKHNDYLHDIKLHLETIDSLFEIVSCQDWTAPARVNAIRDRYRAVAADLDPSISPAKDMISEVMIPVEPMVLEEIFVEPEIIPNVAAAPIAVGGVICPPPPTPAHPMVRPESRVIAVGEPKAPDAGKELAQEEVLEPAAVQPGNESDIDLGEDGDEGDDSGTGLTSGQILRQNRILTFLKEKGGAQVWEIQKIFPSVSKRTIRRDFRSMLKQGLIERFGERNTTSYKLKINLS